MVGQLVISPYLMEAVLLFLLILLTDVWGKLNEENPVFLRQIIIYIPFKDSMEGSRKNANCAHIYREASVWATVEGH